MRKSWITSILFVVVLAFSMPLWAGDDEDEDGKLKLSDVTIKGYYEIQGRGYNDSDIISVKDSALAEALGTDELDTMSNNLYLKHYFHVLPTLKVTEDIKIKSDIVVFENTVSRNDTQQWYGYDSNTPEGQGVYDDYNVFRVDELYAMVTTDIGLFRVGKTAEYNGIGYFIELPDNEAWKFGLIWNKADEHPVFSLGGPNIVDNTHDTADYDEFALKVIYDDEMDIDFDGTLGYRYTGPGYTRCRVWMPYFYLDYKLTDDLILHTMAGTGTGVLIDKESPVGAALGAFLALPSIKTDWEVKDSFTGILGIEYIIDDIEDTENVTLRADAAIATGAKKPQYVSGYIEETVKEEEDKRFDTWLMNDVSDAWAIILETPATTAALNDPIIDGNYTYTNIILARAKIGSQFTKKLGGWVNVAWAQKQNVDYLENWNHNSATQIYQNGVDPVATKLTTKYNIDKDLGWEIHTGIDYKVQENFTVGVDGCFYAPGDFYKDIIEEGAGLGLPAGMSTGLAVEDTYALRWKAKVEF